MEYRGPQEGVWKMFYRDLLSLLKMEAESEERP